jgi:catechol 2,3-dioxygenase-like lactoylglutathione lyase family enzyme
MLPIRGLYEVAIPARQLERAETLYRDLLGLAVGLRDDRRKWLFLRAGGAAGFAVAVQGFLRTSATLSPGLKVLVSAVQSRPCPPVFSRS